MPARNVTITLPAERTEKLLSEIEAVEGLVGIQLQRGGSIQPPGDVITVTVQNNGLPPLFRLLQGEKIGEAEGTSVMTNDPFSLVSASVGRKVLSDRSEIIPEEMETLIAKEANMTRNALILMFVSGMVAAVGLISSSLHYVIGAMMLAPGFLPINRIALGLLVKSTGWRTGLRDTALGYLTLALGAGLAAFIHQADGLPSLSSSTSYLADNVLIAYWQSFSFSSILVSVIAGVAGTVLLTTNRPVLTAGVMIALALVPTAALAAMGLVFGDFSIAQNALLRWLVEAAIVLVTALLVIAWKQAQVHRRETMFQ